MTRIAVLTYNIRHRKTYDTLCLLKAKGYSDVIVYAQPMTYRKKKQPLIQHRPGIVMDIPDSRELCERLDFEYYEGSFTETVPSDDIMFLLCGAGILPNDFIKSYRIINSHPGYIPYARGLDSFKWSIYNKLPIGVTTHFLGEYIDGGEIIERRKILAAEYDTFHSVAQRVYETEIDMLVSAIEKANLKHEFIVPEGDIFKRMPESMEKELFDRFTEYKIFLSSDKF